MKPSIVLKSGIGLVYTTILITAIYFGVVWLTQFVIKLTWTGAVLFWLIGLPIIIGLFQFLATTAAIPTVYLMRGSKWLSGLLLLPAMFFLFSFGRFLWILASDIGGVLIWLLLISWFLETAWIFAVYAMASIGSAYDIESSEDPGIS